MSDSLSTHSSRERAIAAVAKVRNDSNDCACDGCLVDAMLTEVTALLRANGDPDLGGGFHDAAAYLEEEIGRV